METGTTTARNDNAAAGTTQNAETVTTSARNDNAAAGTTPNIETGITTASMIMRQKEQLQMRKPEQRQQEMKRRQ